jgi:Flp pilus assembly protein TadD
MAPDDRFCGACGSSIDGSSPALAPAKPAAPAPTTASGAAMSPVGIVAFGLLLIVGGVAAWMALDEKAPAPRAVAGAPGGPPPADAPPPREDVELPAEVDELLAGLAKAAAEAPEDIEAWQNLTRARYRASVLNAAWRAPAAEALEKLMALDPENPEGLRIAGNIAYDGQDFATAEKHFRKYLEGNDRDAGVHTDLGSALLFQGNTTAAIEAYRDAVDRDPEFLQAWFNLGIALEREERDEEALVALRKAREMAKAPEQQAFIDRAIAALTGEAPPMPADHPPVADGVAGGGMPGAAPGGTAAAGAATATGRSNASTDFQRSAESLLRGYRIVGQRIGEVEWTGPATANVQIAEFPMDKMPPVMRNKFKSGMNESLAKLAGEQGIAEAIDISLVDAATGAVMDKLDGKEWVGAFDEENYQ